MRRPRFLGSLASGVFSGIVLATLAASAQPTKEAEQRSLALYGSAKKHYDEHQYELAASELREAYDLNPKPTLLFNLGLSYRKLGDVDRARDAFIKCAATSTDADEKSRCSAQAEKIERESPRPPPSSSASAPPLATAPLPTATATLPPPPAVQRSAAPFVVMGIGGAGLATGVVLSILATTRHGDAVDDPTQAGTIDKNASAKSFALGANIAFVAGGATAIGGLIWAIADHPSKPRSHAVTLIPWPGGLAIRAKL